MLTVGSNAACRELNRLLCAFFLLLLCIFAYGMLFLTSAYGQLGGIETYEKRKLGAAPPAIEAVLDDSLDVLNRLWVKDRISLHARDKQGRTVLMVAVIQENKPILDYLRDKNVDINAVDQAGNSAIHFAAWVGNTDILQSLLGMEAHIDQQNHNGETPLIMAVRSGHWDTIEALLKACADDQIADFTGRGVMDYAHQSKDRSLVRKLNKAGIH